MERDPRAGQRPEPDRIPDETPEPTTPPSPVPPVTAYRPPRTTPFRTSTVGEGEQPDPPGTDHASAGRPEAVGRKPETDVGFAGEPDDPGTSGRPGVGGTSNRSGVGGTSNRSGAGGTSNRSGAGGTSSRPGAGGVPAAQHGQGAAQSPDDEESSEDDGQAPRAGRPHGSSYTPPPPPPRKKQRSLAGPLILIFLGLFFLGRSFGLIEWSLWEVIWRLWPVWLIAAGLDMLFGQRGGWGRMLAVGVALALVVGIVLGTQPRHVVEQRKEPISIAQPMKGISSAEIHIGSWVSSLQIRGEPLADYLIQGSVMPLAGEEVQWEYDAAGGKGVFRLYSEASGRISTSATIRADWNLVLTDRIPVSLNLDAGVGEGDIDLSRLVVPELSVDAGVGRVSITLPRQGATTGRIDAGVGEVVLRVPAGRPARIRIETGLGGVTADDGFIKQDGYYVTPEYQDGVDAIDLVVSGGVGAVRLVTYE